MNFKEIDTLIVGALNERLMQRVERNFRTHKLWVASDQDRFLEEIGPTIQAVVTSGNPIMGASKSLMDRLPKLQIIVSSGVGYDPIDVAEARRRGIVVTNTPQVLDGCVADMGMALILNIARRIPEAERYTRAGLWKEQGRFAKGVKVGGKVCGIVGLGHIGREVAKRAQVFGMDIHYYDPFAKDDVPYRRHDDLVDLAKQADFLILTLPGGAKTRKIVNRHVLEALGPKGFLVNISRGTVVDQGALVACLMDKVIAGAALDVFEHEPDVPEALFSMENVIVTPHIAANTAETSDAMADLVCENLESYFKTGKVLTPVP